MRKLPLVGLMLLSTLLTSSCNGGSKGSFTIEKVGMVVAQGSNATKALTVTRTGGHKEEIALSAIGTPGGMYVTFSPNPLRVDSPYPTIGVWTAPNLPQGDYQFTIQGTSPSAQATAILNIKVVQ